MKMFLNIAKRGVFVLLISTTICFSEEKVLEDTASPDKTKSLSIIAWNIDEAEHPHTVQLKRSNKVVWSWSKQFTGKVVGCSWSPSSRYAFIYVRHLDTTEMLYLLDTENQPRLYDLHLDVIEDAIRKSFPPFSTSEKFIFGFRSGIGEGTWINPQTCKFAYDYKAFTRAAVAELVLKISQGFPTFAIVSINPAKSEADLDQISERVQREIQAPSVPSVNRVLFEIQASLAPSAAYSSKGNK